MVTVQYGGTVTVNIKNKRLYFAFWIAVCIAIGAAGWDLGRGFISSCLIRRSVEDREKDIARARPWIVDVVRQAKGRLSILVFKKEQIVEVTAPGWTAPRQYEMTGISGRLGPKMREGDRQIPEGIYGIEYLNPNSRFHLPLKISYPNEFDRKRATEDGRSNLGGDIMIHGGSATVGCIPIGDDAIEELFCFVAMVGRENVTVIIAPYDMRKGRVKELERAGAPWYNILCDEIFKALECDTLCPGKTAG